MGGNRSQWLDGPFADRRFEAGLGHEAEQEAVAAVRAEVGATPLWEQLARRVGAEGVVRAGRRLLRGTVVASYPDFFVLEAPEGGQHLVRFDAVSLALPPGQAALQPAPGPANAATPSPSPCGSWPGGARRCGSS